MLMFNSNEPIKVAHLQKLANQSLLNGALVMEIVNNSFRRKTLSFDKAEKVLMEKIKIWKYTCTRFCWNNTLVSECIFKLVYYCESCRWPKICCT